MGKNSNKKRIKGSTQPAASSFQWFSAYSAAENVDGLGQWDINELEENTRFVGFILPEYKQYTTGIEKKMSWQKESIFFAGKAFSGGKDRVADLLQGIPLSFKEAIAVVVPVALARALDEWWNRDFSEIKRFLYTRADLSMRFIGLNLEQTPIAKTGQFHIGNPFKNMRLPYAGSNSNQPIYRKLFWVISLFMLISMVWMSKDAGISGDEFTQHEFSDMVIDYYAEGDSSALFQPKTLMHLYGSSFDTFCNVIIKAFNLKNTYESRHLINSIFGWLAILFVGLLAMRLTDWRTALIALLLIYFSPRFLGHSLNNPKDVPFALGYIMALYYTIRLFSTYPQLRMRTAVMLAISLALGLSIRVGGLLSFAYVFVMLAFVHFGLYGVASLFKNAQSRKQLINAGIFSVITLIGAYMLGLLPWPYGLQSPIENPLNAFREFSSFSVGIRQLFEGENIMSKELPNYYLFKYLWITTPLIILLGLGFFAVLSLPSLNLKNWSAPLVMIVFALVFPVAYIFYKGSNVYGGLRHVLFILPVLAITGALGFQRLMKQVESKKWGLPLVGVLILSGLSFPAIHTIKNHPYQYIYFNLLSGGTGKVYGQYELDYYHASHKEASEWLIDYLNRNNAWGSEEKPIRIVSNFTKATRYYFRNEPIDQKDIEYSRYYEKNQNNWDYFIMNNTYINAFHVKNGLYPPKGTIHTIDLNGKPICAIIKRPSYDDVNGFDLYKKGDYAKAIESFESYLKTDPTESTVHNALANCYMMLGQNDKAGTYAQQAIQYYPDYTEALFTVGRIQMNQGQMQNAILTFDNVLRDSPSSYGAWYLKAYAQFLMKDYNNALQSLEQCLNYNQGFRDAYLLGASIYEAQGNAEQAKRLRDVAAQIK